MGLVEVLKNKILVLDGAMGTMIQQFQFKESDFRGSKFLHHPKSLAGFNDILNITKPSAILSIHKAYIEAGANIISTNTFNSNTISMRDYGLDSISGLCKRLNKEGALLARKAVDEYKQQNKEGVYLVGGSIGPTNRSASMSPDITNPLIRNVEYRELFETYKEQAEGLIEGGVDLIICETVFDTLNLKAALDASNQVMKIKGTKLPILVSATVSDNSGRILSGQAIEAFVTSIAEYENVTIIGINCGFGPEMMKDFIKRVRKINPHFTSCHPNAGLPDETGCYKVDAKDFCNNIKPLFEEGLVNIVGGCCGTTPDFIKELSKIVKEISPTPPVIQDPDLRLSGLDMLIVKDKFLRVGERCNVAGSKKFLRLIKEGSLEEAAEIAKQQIKNGASIIDINMDDPLLDAEKEMVKFLRYIMAEPDIAKVPFMIDSSKWSVIEESLKNIQGKGIVNSISLKEGEENFIEKALRVKELGFALVVMAFDEKGQADTFDKKIEVCQRSYDILTKKCGYLPQDIIFDVNVMTIATGMKEHARYAVDFINTISWIKNNLPGTKTSGGISNLSFAFRGKNKIREYMHEIFLHHAKSAGLDMAIINPSQKVDYKEIPDEIKHIIEDIIFDKDPEAVEKLISLANELETDNKKEPKSLITNPEHRTEELLKQDLLEGDLTKIEEHIHAAIEQGKNPVEIIQGPLLEGMKKVGDLFGEGKMFLPQVVKTARVMKKAVDLLTPLLEKNLGSEPDKKAGKILIATVKGDVHDIGKNIVSTVLSCNNYEIIDLGIMVEPATIVEQAIKEKPDIICLSGLISPSLVEMTNTVMALKAAGINVPVMVGGAATSKLHTALKIDSEYSGTVLHMEDASRNPIAANLLLNDKSRESYLKEVQSEYEILREGQSKKISIEPFYKLLEIIKQKKANGYRTEVPRITSGELLEINIPLQKVIALINWKMFFLAWKLRGIFLETIPSLHTREERTQWLEKLDIEDKQKAIEALQLYDTAQEIINEIIKEEKFDGKGIIRFEKAHGDLKNIYVSNHEFPMLRQQTKGSEFLSCSDFIGSCPDNYIGFFAVTSGNKMPEMSKRLDKEGDNYRAIIVQALADRIVEASAEWLQNYVSENLWTVNIRPAWGYPMLPDQTMILQTEDLLQYNKIGVTLTENGGMYPPATISGLLIQNPNARYFMVGQIGDDQIKDYAERRGVSEKRIKDILRQI